jgi:exodeoxyribonuclease VII large subunit
METERRNYVTLCRALPSLVDLLALPRQKLDHSSARLNRALGGNLEGPSRRLAEIGGRLGRGLQTAVTRNGHRFSAVATPTSA